MMTSIPLVIFALVFGSLMIMEGTQILVFKRQIVPLPTRLLVWMGMLVFGKEKSGQRFAKQDTLQDLKTYGWAAIVLGGLILLSCMMNLYWSIIV
jgi:hypothetical protein